MSKAPSFQLFVTGRSEQSRQAIDSLRQICEQHLLGRCDVHIIDLLKEPEWIQRDGILATPLLIRTNPQPPCRVLGDFTDLASLMLALGYAD